MLQVWPRARLGDNLPYLFGFILGPHVLCDELNAANDVLHFWGVLRVLCHPLQRLVAQSSSFGGSEFSCFITVTALLLLV